MGGRELLEHRRQRVGRERRSRAERQPSCATALERVHDLPSVGERLERANGEGQKGLARLGQPHPARGAVEELGRQFLLEPLEPRRQGRLRHEQRVGRAADAGRSRNLDETLDLRKLHITKFLLLIYRNDLLDITESV